MKNGATIDRLHGDFNCTRRGLKKKKSILDMLSGNNDESLNL